MDVGSAQHLVLSTIPWGRLTTVRKPISAISEGRLSLGNMVIIFVRSLFKLTGWDRRSFLSINVACLLITITICQTWQILSSATEHITQGSFKFQLKSLILLVWPPWTNYIT